MVINNHKSVQAEQPAVKKGNVVTVHIASLASGGIGLGEYQGRACFVEGAYPGDLVEAEIFRVKRTEMHARFLSLKESKIHRINPRCSHFGHCGGCRWQDIEYEEQVRLKENLVFSILNGIDGFQDTEFQPIVPSPDEFFYRNKMEFSFAPDENGNPLLGLHPPRRWYEVFDLKECFLQSPQSNVVVGIIRQFALNKGLDACHPKTHEGFLRYLTVREGKNTGEFLVHLITSPGTLPDSSELFRELQHDIPGLKAFIHSITGSKAGIARGEQSTIPGEMDFIRETMGNLVFRISPHSFFPTNTNQGITLYRKILEFAEPKENEQLLDLYCGTGTIALFCANHVKEVVGVELSNEAVADAELNATWNHFHNTRFICGDVRKVLDNLGHAAIAVCDPPRAGMHPRALEKLAEMEPDRIIYVSCNPYVMPRDLSRFIEYRYQPLKVCCLDLFPQTPHIETVILLKKYVNFHNGL